MTRVLVCGGRDFTSFADKAVLEQVLNSLEPEYGIVVTLLIAGGANGADTLAQQWAKKKQIQHHIFPAQWKKYGKSAGFKRNTQMLQEGQPDYVIAFPGGVGTRMMSDLARKEGVQVLTVDQHGVVTFEKTLIRSY